MSSDDDVATSGVPCRSGLLATAAATDRLGVELAHPRRPGAGFWVIGGVFAVTVSTGTAPAPLYALYQETEGFGPLTSTAIFAVYAVGVAVSLMAAGHVSDHLGRRRLLMVSILLSILAVTIFLTSSGVVTLLLARFVSGLGIGLLVPTATAYLAELVVAVRPQLALRRAEMVATGANLGGLSLGPLLVSLIAENATEPTRTPFVVLLFLLIGAALAAATTPETVRTDTTWRYRSMRVAVPLTARRRYAVALLLACTASALFGLVTSVAPALLANGEGQGSLVQSGAVTSMVLACAAIFQILLASRTSHVQALVGTTLMTIGLITLTAGLHWDLTVTVLSGGAIAGAGAGAAYRSATGAVVFMAASHVRSEALAGLFLCGYAGMAVPVLGLGLLTLHLSLQHAVLIFAGVLTALSLAAFTITYRDGRSRKVHVAPLVAPNA